MKFRENAEKIDKIPLKFLVGVGKLYRNFWKKFNNLRKIFRKFKEICKQVFNSLNDFFFNFSENYAEFLNKF